jgi:8-oxo-dGTP diphosphatase
MTFQYDYSRPMVTVDILVLRIYSGQLQILFVKRKQDPFAGKWALPGGFVGIDERLLEAASRELREETGLGGCQLVPLFQADEPARDPRGRTISHVFGTVLSSPVEVKAGDDAAEAQWFSLDRLPDLAFDHDNIVKRGLQEFKYQALFKLDLLKFLNEKFSRQELEELCLVMFDQAGVSSIILEMVLNMKLIQKQGKEFYRKKTGDRGSHPADFALLSGVWLSKKLSR